MVRVSRSRSREYNGYKISYLELDHKGCTGVSKISARQVANLSSAQAAVLADCSIKGKALQTQVKSMEGIVVPKRMMYRARDSINDDIDGGYAKSFKRLKILLSEFKTKNDTAAIDFEVTSDNHFKRAFISAPYCECVQNYSLSILGVDGAFMKHGKYKETMLSLVGLDGNKNIITYATALCASEDSSNYQWFFNLCKEAGIIFDGTVVFSDRSSGLLSVSASMNDITLIHCTRHIVGNMKSIFKKSLTSLAITKPVSQRLLR